MGVVFFSW